MTARLEFALDAAYRAGESTLRGFEAGCPVEEKADSSPVTAADREAEHILRSMIESRWPGEAILGEEFGGEDACDRWVLDPIDGTKSFVCGVPLFATLVSFEVDRRPILGVARFPALGMSVYAERGSGAYRDGTAVRVSADDDLARATICCAGPGSLHRLGMLEAIGRLAHKCRAMRTWCDAYGHCLVALGRAAAMIDPVLSPWDLSAVRIIVEEAGGRCTSLDGSEPVDGAISAAPALHSTLLEALRP